MSSPSLPVAQNWRPAVPAAETIGHFFVALIFLTSFYVKFEPAICDLMFFAAFIFFLRSGLLLSPALAPLLLLLVIYNVAGLVSYIQIADDPYGSGNFVVTSFYMSLSGFFFAAYVAADPENRFQYIMKWYFWGAVIASVLGLLGYFRVSSVADMFVFNQRMVSGFKDPNVFATYLVLPAVYVLQGLMLGKLRFSLLTIAGLLMILMALFLAFSRGAWINFSMAAALMIGLSVLFSPDRNQQASIIFKGAIAIGVMALILVVLLSVKETRHLFLDRFTLVKEYDAGEMGRFGNQRNAVPLLLVRPFGFGPLQFGKYFREAPHNTFLNAFSSFGWAGGIAFFTMMCVNLYVGCRMVLARTSFQASAIVVLSCLFAVTFQGVQIDTEHWRHLYWMIGITWGFFGAFSAGVAGSEEQNGWTLAALTPRGG